MTNPRSAANAWAKIRNKLNLTTADGAAVAIKKTPQKKKATADKVDGAGESKRHSSPIDTIKLTPARSSEEDAAQAYP